MNRFFTLSILFASFVFASFFITANSYAEEETIMPVYQETGTIVPENTSIPSEEFKGTVFRVSDTSIVVRTAEEDMKEIEVSSGITIKRNGVLAKKEDIVPGDTVTVTESNGQVLSIEAISGSLIDYGKWAIPGVILALLLAFLIWKFLNDKNKPHIKTHNMDKDI